MTPKSDDVRDSWICNFNIQNTSFQSKWF